MLSTIALHRITVLLRVGTGTDAKHAGSARFYCIGSEVRLEGTISGTRFPAATVSGPKEAIASWRECVIVLFLVLVHAKRRVHSRWRSAHTRSRQSFISKPATPRRNDRPASR